MFSLSGAHAQVQALTHMPTLLGSPFLIASPSEVMGGVLVLEENDT